MKLFTETSTQILEMSLNYRRVNVRLTNRVNREVVALLGLVTGCTVSTNHRSSLNTGIVHRLTSIIESRCLPPFRNRATEKFLVESTPCTRFVEFSPRGHEFYRRGSNCGTTVKFVRSIRLPPLIVPNLQCGRSFRFGRGDRRQESVTGKLLLGKDYPISVSLAFPGTVPGATIPDSTNRPVTGENRDGEETRKSLQADIEVKDFPAARRCKN